MQVTVSMKNLMHIFQSSCELEKQVESFTLEIVEDCKLLVVMNCRHSVIKQFKVKLEACKAQVKQTWEDYKEYK